MIFPLQSKKPNNSNNNNNSSAPFRLEIVHVADIQTLSSSSLSFARPLYIRNFSVPESIDWFELFYNAFQKYGRLVQCRKEAAISSSAEAMIIQYALQEDADKAATEMASIASIHQYILQKAGTKLCFN